MGWRYVSFRAAFEVKKRSGLLLKRFPTNTQPDVPICLSKWKEQKRPFFDRPDADINIDRSGLSADAKKIREGQVCFFGNQWYPLGRDYDWVTNPVTGFRYDSSAHWTAINDYSRSAGDIKYVWEKSRFSYVYTLMRDEHWNGASHGEFIFTEIMDWIDRNPVNQGPNYKCSQEISVRVLNWIRVLYFYCDDPALSDERWNKIIDSIGWQIRHVYGNIDFSRIAVRNNHALTETLALYITGLIFPWFSEASTWKRKGKKWFETEVAYQVYPDGTFLQFSMNYHRVVIQLLTMATGVARLNEESFDSLVYERAYQSLDFLYQCQQPENGMLPNYGANDGALFFPLNNCSFRDYRPQLNALHTELCGEPLYGDKKAAWNEDACWFGGGLKSPRYGILQKKSGCISYPVGGYYLIREQDSFTFIRCGNHKDRPSQADNLHLDIWINGENLVHDAGSYRYNADDEALRFFMGTASHNTVMIDDHDQMLKGSRFIWYHWSRCQGKPRMEETPAYFMFTGSVSAFRFLNRSIVHTRIVRKIKGKNEWQVKDMLAGKERNWMMKQLWHIRTTAWPRVRLQASDGDSLATEQHQGWCSELYGEKTPSPYQVFRTNNSIIETTLNID